VETIVFGAWDPKAGACGSLKNVVADERLNHQVKLVPGVRQEECAAILRLFFQQLRQRDQTPPEA
jgi:tRNA(adenine34) deaminase